MVNEKPKEFEGIYVPYGYNEQGTIQIDDLNGCYNGMFNGCSDINGFVDDKTLPTYPYSAPPAFYGPINDSGWVDTTTEAGQDRIRKHNINSWKAICHILTHK